jgi:hypothetical protein|tara:strand:+ start:245 stop:874 length:630 start_codon:yes stop_codon:yes gene_type:complete
MAIAATTQLESLNIMLAAIGESPLNSRLGGIDIYTDTLPTDAQVALNILTEQSKMIQSEGWSFNTEIDVTLPRDNFKKIALGVDVLRVDPNVHDHPNIDAIQRGLKMYDRLNNTFEFDKDLICTIVYFREFDEIPEPARNYITIKAARIFIDRQIGDDSLRAYNQQDEARARAVLLETDTLNADHNLLRGDPSLTSVFETYSPSKALIR